jgi:hypothetical protein
MTALTAFGIGLGTTSLLLAGTAALVLHPLARSLRELCGTKERGDFWTAVSSVAFAAGSLLLGLLGFWCGPTDRAGLPLAASHPEALFWSPIEMARWTAVGLLLGLFALAAIVARFTARLSRGAACPPPARREESPD